MKNLLLFLSFTFVASQLCAQQLKFKDSKYNFGFAHEGDIVTMQFDFENTGTAPLIISDYQVECGCTVMEKPEKSILPGEKSSLKVTFDTHDKYDRQDREVTVISNALNNPQVIRFKGVVLKPKKKD